MNNNKNQQTNDKPKHLKSERLASLTKAAAWFVVAGSQLFGAYVLLLNFHNVVIVTTGILQCLLGLGIVAYNFYKSN